MAVQGPGKGRYLALDVVHDALVAAQLGQGFPRVPRAVDVAPALPLDVELFGPPGVVLKVLGPIRLPAALLQDSCTLSCCLSNTSALRESIEVPHTMPCSAQHAALQQDVQHARSGKAQMLASSSVYHAKLECSR